jgi:hypothetical protein
VPLSVCISIQGVKVHQVELLLSQAWHTPKDLAESEHRYRSGSHAANRTARHGHCSARGEQCPCIAVAPRPGCCTQERQVQYISVIYALRKWAPGHHRVLWPSSSPKNSATESGQDSPCSAKGVRTFSVAVQGRTSCFLLYVIKMAQVTAADSGTATVTVPSGGATQLNAPSTSASTSIVPGR